MEKPFSHPYLYFTADDLPGIRKRLEHPWMARKWKHLLRLGDVLMTEKDMLPEPAEDGTEAHYTPAGLAFTVRVRLLSFLWLMSGERRYLDRAKQHLLHVCGWRRWCGLGADGRVQPTIDAGIFGSAASIAYDWLFDELTEAERKTVRRALTDFTARPICRKYLVDDRREMTGLENNWPSQWFEAVGLVGLVLSSEEPESSGWIRHAENIFRGILYYYNCPDGGGHEGAGYVQYLAQNAVLFVEALRRVTGTTLLDSPFLTNLRHFILHTSYFSKDAMWRVNFNDTARADESPAHQKSLWHNFRGTVCNGPLVLYLAREYRDQQCIWLYGKSLDLLESVDGILSDTWNSPFEVIWFDPALQAESPEGLPLSRRFRGVDWVVSRTGWKPSDTFFAFKSGRTAWWHIHSDKNHFILWANGERLIVDPGIAPYLFNPAVAARMEEISTFYRNTGHNILTVDGQGQLSDPSTSDFHFYGPEAGRAESIEQAGRVLDFLDAGFGFYLRADATRPYYGRLRRWHRSIFSAGLRYLVMLDEVECNGARRIEWTLHTPKGLELARNTAVLSKDGKALMTITVLHAGGARVAKKEGFDEGLIWIPPEEKLEGDPLRMVPRADCLTIEPAGPVAETSVLTVIDVHRDGKRRVDGMNAVSGSNFHGARIAENGRESLALFRTGPGQMQHAGAATDATFAFLSPLKKPRQLMVSECESFALDGTRYVLSSRPITAGLEYRDSGIAGSISALTTTEVRLHFPRRPSAISVNGSPVELRYDDETRMASFPIRRGTFVIEAH